MRALLGEENVKLFPARFALPISISYKEFFHNYRKNVSQIILDKSSCVDFSLDNLKNIYAYDAFKSLFCKRKSLEPNEAAYLIKKKKFPLLSKSNFYVQTSIISDVSLFQKVIKASDGVFLIEHVICKLCKSVTDISEETWWLYIAEHKSSGIKIVAGVGDGIAYSRSFCDSSEIEKKVVETIRFLAREGLNKNVKIISFINNLCIERLNIVNPSHMKNDIENVLIDIIASDKNIRPQFSSNNCIRRFFHEYNYKICASLIASSLICLASICYLRDKSVILKNDIEIGKKRMSVFVKDKSKNFSAKINCESINAIRSFIDASLQMKNPIRVIEKAFNALNELNIKARQVLIGKYDIKIQCAINDEQLNRLKKTSVNMKKISEGESEYERLDESIDRKYDVEICIKTK